MFHRFLFLSAILGSLVVTNAYAEAIEIPSTSDNSDKAPVLAENDINQVPAEIEQGTGTPAVSATLPSVQPHHSSLQANLSLKQEGQRLYAYVVLEQSQAKSGKIRIDWTPPAKSSCDKSSYILSYEGKRFHTAAYRTLGYGLINGKSVTCTGTWQADVKNAHGVKLTTATINVEAVDAFAKANTSAKTNPKMMKSLAAIA